MKSNDSSKKRGALANVVKDCITVVSEAKTLIKPGPMQHLQGGDTSYHIGPVPDIAWQHVATIKQEEARRLFPSEADALSFEEADAEAELRQSEADQALEKDGLVIPFPHEKLRYFAMKLPNTFNADVVVIFSVASGALVKAVFLKHKYAVCFAPTLHAQEVAHAWLLTLKHGKVLPPRPTIPKPEEEDYNWGQVTNQQCSGAPQEDYELPQNDGSKPHGMSLYCHVLKATIQYCSPCDRWLRATEWEDHLIGKSHKKNKDNKRKDKLGHHKVGKKCKKNENQKKMQHKKRSVQKKAGLPVPPLVTSFFLRCAVQELLGHK